MSRQKKIWVFLVVVFFLVLVGSAGVFAAVAAPDLELPNPLGADSIPDLIAQIFKVLAYYITPPIAGLMIVFGAFQIMTAGGDPEKYKTGIKTIKYTVFGLAIVLLGSLIARLVAEILGAPKEVQDALKNLGP